MNKLLTLLLVLSTSSAFASQVPSLKRTQEINNQPMLELEVYKIAESTQMMNLVKGRKISRTQQNQRLCWTAFNMPFDAHNRIVEIFTSPKSIQFSSEDSLVKVSKDKKQHTIQTNVKSYNNEYIQRCWRFEQKDPVGKYTLSIQVNDVKFPAQTFEVVK